jgi:hypothetical protein
MTPTTRLIAKFAAATLRVMVTTPICTTQIATSCIHQPQAGCPQVEAVAVHVLTVCGRTVSD